MTILQPPKIDFKTNIWIGFGTVAFISMALSGIWFYNDLVNIRHDMGSYKITLREAEVKNAELKDNLYALNKVNQGESFAKQRGLILEKNPDYVKINESPALSVNH